MPEDVQVLELRFEDLPENWDSKPPSILTQYIEDDFVKNNEATVHRVPSNIVPSEYNYLINPNYPDAKRIKLISTKKLSLNNRFKQ